jgi:hypothetical protein
VFLQKKNLIIRKDIEVIHYQLATSDIFTTDPTVIFWGLKFHRTPPEIAVSYSTFMLPKFSKFKMFLLTPRVKGNATVPLLSSSCIPAYERAVCLISHWLAPYIAAPVGPETSLHQQCPEATHVNLKTGTHQSPAKRQWAQNFHGVITRQYKNICHRKERLLYFTKGKLSLCFS